MQFGKKDRFAPLRETSFSRILYLFKPFAPLRETIFSHYEAIKKICVRLRVSAVI